jgi:predicted transposase/invertase (TIGR01784 family)
MITKYLDPKNDIAFRKIFGSEKNKEILIHFLNDMLVFREGKPIKDITFLKTNQHPELAYKKESIVDVLCKDEVGHQYIVEMQVANQKGFEKRAQYYAAKAYISQMNKGDKLYNNLKEVIFLAIVDFTMFSDKQEYKSDHVILDQNTHENDLKDFSFTFLELPKFKKDKHQLNTMIDKWAYYFKHAEDTPEEDLADIFKDDEFITQAYKELDRFHWDEKDLLDYDQEIKRIRDNHAVLAYQLEQAENKGIEKGIEKGAVDTAQKMITDGIAVEMIAKYTGLPPSVIDELKTENSNQS